MKRIYFFLVAVFFVYGSQAQNIQLNFTGSGLSTSVESVEVTNLTTDAKVTLAQGDVLLLTGTTSIPTVTAGERKMIMYPNPMQEKGNISFQTSVPGTAGIEVFDISGKLVTRSVSHLSEGMHTFSVSGLSKGMYTVRVNTADQVYTGSLVSTLANAGSPSLELSNSGNALKALGVLKSGKAEIAMPYVEGQRLLIKGKSGNYSRVLTLVPSANQAVNFEFIACTDGSGFHYPVVTIGTQTWMAANLNTYKLNDGTMIENGGPLDNETFRFSPLALYAWYMNDSATYHANGKLYNHNAVLTEKLCPVGWFIPDSTEIATLLTHLGWPEEGHNAGGKLKETGYASWPINEGATNETGFSARNSGIRAQGGGWSGYNLTLFRSTSLGELDQGVITAYFLRVQDNGLGGVGRERARIGASVRCIKRTE